MSEFLSFSITGIGLIGPGWNNWPDARTMLAHEKTPGRSQVFSSPSGGLARSDGSGGAKPLVASQTEWSAHTPTLIPAPTCLPPAERRRAGSLVRLALNVADQACADSGLDLSQLSTVFSTSSGEPTNCHVLCETLASADRKVSPTRFTNSVHNAAAGYWHIANHCMAASTSLCSFNASCGAGLLEAAAQCVSEQRPVLMVSVDVPYPEPLHGARPLPEALGLALLLRPSSAPNSTTHAAVRLSLKTPAMPHQITLCKHPQLDAMRCASPVGRALPLLQALARRAAHTTELYLDYLDGLALHLEVGWCDE
jgi:hypothetical protein